MKKLIAFDLDGTLSDSKSPVEDEIIEKLEELLKRMNVCVMSGGKFEQFKKQLISRLNIEPKLLTKLHIMPTCGTRYYRYNQKNHKWEKQYSEDFTEREKTKIIEALNKGFDDLGYREKHTYGDAVEDRGSQITFSALGQSIVEVLGVKGLKKKEDWDPDSKKKNALQNYIAPLIPQFEVRVGGVSSIDVTKKGIDKAYGIRKLTEILKVKKQDILFIGDRLQPGGNDYPVKLFGVDSVEISHWRETALAIQIIIYMVQGIER